MVSLITHSFQPDKRKEKDKDRDSKEQKDVKDKEKEKEKGKVTPRDGKEQERDPMEWFIAKFQSLVDKDLDLEQREVVLQQ